MGDRFQKYGDTVPTEEAKRQVKLALRRLAMYHAAMCQTLKAELGDQAGLALAEKTADRYGEMIGLASKEKAEAAGLDLTIENYQEDLPSLGFEGHPVSVKPRINQVDNCPLALTWKELGCEEDGRIYCRVDQAKFKAYNPELVCTHDVHIIRDKTDHCQVAVRDKD